MNELVRITYKLWLQKEGTELYTVKYIQVICKGLELGTSFIDAEDRNHYNHFGKQLSRIYYILKCGPFYLDKLCSQHDTSYINTHLLLLFFDFSKLDHCYTLNMPCSCFFFDWCIALLFYLECHSSLFLPIKASLQNVVQMSCSSSIISVTQLTVMLFSLNSLFGIHLRHQLKSELITSLTSPCDFNNVAFLFFLFFPPSISLIPSLTMKLLGLSGDFLKETQVLNVRL